MTDLPALPLGQPRQSMLSKASDFLVEKDDSIPRLNRSSRTTEDIMHRKQHGRRKKKFPLKKYDSAEEIETPMSPVELDPAMLDFERKWKLWYKLKNDKGWNVNVLATIGNVKDFWSYYNFINPIVYEEWVFLMLDDIRPCIEDADNPTVGTIRIEVNRNNITDIWMNMSLLLVGETIYADNWNANEHPVIIGMSTQPKHGNSIVSLWVNKVPKEGDLFVGFNKKEIAKITKIKNIDFNVKFVSNK